MAQTIDLGLVKGAKGDTGDTGATGATGPQGPQGEQGPAGEGFPSGGVQNQTAIVNASAAVEWVDPLDMKNRLGIASITDATAIVASDNVDNFRTIGTYYCETDAIAESLVQVPTDLKFVMVVSKSNATDEYIGQEIIESVKGTRFFRSYKLNTGTWSNWRKTLDIGVIAGNADSSVVPVENGGTGADNIIEARENLEAWGKGSPVVTFDNVAAITANSGFIIAGVTFSILYDRLVHIYIKMTSVSALSSSTAYTIGTLNERFCPVQSTPLGDYRATGSVTTAGTLNYMPTVARTAGSSIYLVGLYVLENEYTG